MLSIKLKIKTLLFTLLLVSSYLSNGQQVNKDSVDLYLRNAKIVNGNFDSKIAKLCLKIERQDNAKLLYQYMDSIAPNPKSKLLFYNKYISYLYRINQVDKGLKKASVGIELAKGYKLDKILFEYTQIKSYGFIMTSSADSALYYANEAEKLVLKNKNLLGENLFRVHMRKSDIEALMGNFEQRDLFFEKAVESIEAYPKSKNTAYVLSTVTYHFKINKNYKKHSIYSQKLKAHYIKNGGFKNPNKHMSISSFLEFEDSKEQVSVLEKSLNFSEDSTLTMGQRDNINTLSESLINVGESQKAIQYLKLNTEQNNSYPLAHKLLSYSLLESAYLKMDDCDNTLATVNQKAILIDSLRSQEMIAKIADSKVKYETEKKEAQLQLLKLEKEKEKQKKNLFTIIAILGMGLVALTTYFLYKNKLKNRKLNNQNVLLERTVDEKNVLLREVHHRVKNSFQIVSSLLYLQSENITDVKAKRAIKEAENRVRSMVLVHQKLYNKDELVGINTKEYFEDLIKDIFDSHYVKDEPITYNLNIEPLVLDIETITPLGLILNELIINTMKHAFEGIESDQKIDVNFVKQDDQLVLKVADNGKGFEGEIKQSSFGIMLMKALSKQLKATLSHNSQKDLGTEVKLVIKKFNLL
jgi:two-component sensor histidine kinase